MIRLLLLVTLTLCSGIDAWAQGQDSTPWERDWQVIQTLLPGTYNNANQAYFDGRLKKPVRHKGMQLKVEALSSDGSTPRFLATTYRNGDKDKADATEIWALSSDDTTGTVRMRIWALGENDDPRKLKRMRERDYCDVYWQREVGQFVASRRGECGSEFATDYVLGTTELWVKFAQNEASDFKLHRARMFECYVDMPGVGGGRDEPYERYDGFKIHDQGDQFWFTSKEGREIGVSLFLVDWPMNNYTGVFTRNSFVIYVSEKFGEETKEISYAFTVPDADRIGINLKWMLANCFMQSNAEAIPSM